MCEEVAKMYRIREIDGLVLYIGMWKVVMRLMTEVLFEFRIWEMYFGCMTSEEEKEIMLAFLIIYYFQATDSEG